MYRRSLRLLIISLFFASCQVDQDVHFHKLSDFSLDEQLKSEIDSVHLISSQQYMDNSLDLKVLYHHLIQSEYGDTINLLSPICYSDSSHPYWYLEYGSEGYWYLYENLVNQSDEEAISVEEFTVVASPKSFEKFNYLHYPTLVGVMGIYQDGSKLISQ